MYAPLDINGIPNDIEVALQYFEITEGNISDAEALRYYHANIFDL